MSSLTATRPADALRRLARPTGLVALLVVTAALGGAARGEVASVAATGGAVLAPTSTGASRSADGAGSVAPGRTTYAPPAGAVFVAPTGSDSAAGSSARPVRTIARALALAPTGGTVVLRAGTYHESVVSRRRVTIQSYPREAAWLDGSVRVSGWVKDGTTWRKDGWTARFDASVGYNRGDRDNTEPGWRWLDPAHPMAAHPDEVFVDGVAQRQVASRAKVVPGTFYLDEDTSRLYLGSNPTGRQVRGTTLAHALTVLGSGSVVRGIGVRRFAPSIWHIGAVTVEAPKVRLEQVRVEDSATIGVGVVASDVTLRRVSVLRSGLLGVHAATADRLTVASSRLDRNNTERFNSAPVSGGIKVGWSRTVVVKDSSISGNAGQGYWSDESVYDTRILNNNVVGNRAAGVFLEISARGTIVNNLVTDNGGDGLKINNTSDVRIYNNTVVHNGRALDIVQDPRLPTNTSYGQDPRHPRDPEMTWLLGPVVVRNNVIGLPTSSANCVLCVEDYSYQRTAAQMGVTSNGNVFNRAGAQTTRWLTVWSRGRLNVNPSVYTSLKAHRAGTHQDPTSRAYYGTTVVGNDGTLSRTVQARAATSAVPLPADIAALAGATAGTRHLGVFGRG